jgi:predicted ATP-dependent protease
MDQNQSSSKKPSPDCWELQPADLEFPLNPSELGFLSTNELEPLDQVVGQDRALRALEFGLAVPHRGYNVFVSGMTGTGRKQLIQHLLEERARSETTPADWVYVHNFDEPDRPLALRLPSGHGVGLRAALEQLIDRLRRDLPAALKAKDFDAERQRLASVFGKRSEALFDQLAEHARRLDMVLRRTPEGMLLFIPLKDGKPIDPQEMEQLSDEQRADIERRQSQLGELASKLAAEQQELSSQLREQVQEIIRAFARRIADPLIATIKTEHPVEALSAWLDRARQHLLDHLERLQEEQQDERANLPAVLRAAAERADAWLEFRVNVVADNSHSCGAPVVVEISPSYKNLFGTIEHDVNLFGRVSTNFMRIKPGSLLRANGGYLLFDLEDALSELLVWRQLKRTLKSGKLLTDVYEPLALLATAALKPEPIPISTKVIVIGSPDLYYLLQFYDDDFRELFKVRADFGPETQRNADMCRSYARFVAKQVRAEELLPFDAAAVAEVIRFGAREVAQQDKLSMELGIVADIIREAAHWARATGATQVGADHVRQTLDERVYRSDRIAAKVRELIAEGTLRISIAGRRVGQVNGLSVWDLGDYRFGRPSRVTATVGIGQEGLVNIERECDLSGSTHNKGVLILEGYLRGRYARRHPLALSASLAFEQSYGWVEGDSASSAELYCLLRACFRSRLTPIEH